MSALSATRSTPTMKRVVVGLLLAGAVFLIYRAGGIVRPFLWASILGYILLPLVRVFEERLSGRRSVAAAVVFIAVLLSIGGGVRFLAPLAIAQLQSFQRLLPTLIANGQNTLAETLDQIGAEDLGPIVFGPIATAPNDVTPHLAGLPRPFLVGLSPFLLHLLPFLVALFFFLPPC